MKNSNVVNIHEYKINRNYYNIGLIIGALRAELEKGTVSLGSAYGLLADGVKSTIDIDRTYAGGAIR